MLSQADRGGQLKSPLGEDALCLLSFQAQEVLSGLFEVNLSAVSEDAEIDPNDLIGKPFSIKVKTEAGERFYHGLATEGQWTGQMHDLSVYRFLLRPWPWLLTKTTDCRIYHDKTVVEIIKDVFQRRGFSDYRFLTNGNFPVLHYTVQYCETDWNFVSRLAEAHGIYYFFKHSEDKHELLLLDSLSGHHSAGSVTPVEFLPRHEAMRATRKTFFDHWAPERSLRSGVFVLTDYNHLTPTAQMLAKKSDSQTYQHAQQEVFDYPGPHVEQGQGMDYAKVRLEAEQAFDRRRHASGVAVVAPGSLIDFSNHPRKGENGQYFVVRMESQLGPQSYRSTGVPDKPFSGDYELQLSSVQYRAPLDTPKPLIHSMQTATVVGQKGEEIDCDDHGRILVHFYWDRHDDKSCRLRVSQIWGGQQWGGQVIPRIGMEVMVAYLDGDPDRPIVVGCVPNPKTLKVPDELPKFKTRMVLKSKSNKAPGFNELRFEDEASQEEIWLHAQKYMNAHILDNETREIGGNRATSIALNQSETVGTDKGGGDNDVRIFGHDRKEVKKTSNLTVEKERSVKVKGQDTLLVDKDRVEELKGNWTVKVGASTLHKSADSQEIETGQSIYLKAGMSIIIEAGMQISLKVGGNFIDISPAGIAISGTMVLINSGGAAGSGAPVSPGSPVPPQEYGGPAAVRYKRSYEL